MKYNEGKEGLKFTGFEREANYEFDKKKDVINVVECIEKIFKLGYAVRLDPGFENKVVITLFGLFGYETKFLQKKFIGNSIEVVMNEALQFIV